MSGILSYWSGYVHNAVSICFLVIRGVLFLKEIGEIRPE